MTPRQQGNLKRGTVDLAILAALEDGERYGHEILERIRERSNDAFSFTEASLYVNLKKLTKAGLLESRWQESPAGGAPRKYYKLTSAGEKALERKRQEWKSLRDAVEAFLAGTGA